MADSILTMIKALFMNELDEFYNKLYNLSYIVRYSTVPRIKNESVAEHSFYVASIVIKLHETYIFDLHKAVTMAVMHDWTESWIDDTTCLVKDQFPDIAKAVKDAERYIVNNYFNNELHSLWYELDAKQTIESLIVHLADVIQCGQYAKHEIKLGNDGYMQKVLDLSEFRINMLESSLHEFKRNNIKSKGLV